MYFANVPLLEILVTVPLEEHLTQRILSLSPGDLSVFVVPSGVSRSPFPSDREAAAIPPYLAERLVKADVLFGYWGRQLQSTIRFIGPLRKVAPKLRWIQLTSAGGDQIDLPAMSHIGVAVTTAGAAHAIPVAELVVAAMLAFTKGIIRSLHAQLDKRWNRFLPSEFSGSTVGIVGLGAIGCEVARLSKCLGCRVVGIRRSESKPIPFGVDAVYPPSNLSVLLRESDFVVVAVPLTEETAGLIGGAELRQMRQGAVLVNVSRGAVVVEESLVKALSEGIIGGAALDVFEREPLPSTSALWATPNALLTPHIAGGSDRYEERAVMTFCDNLRLFMKNLPLRNLLGATEERG
jgi:phosphoglycerate dehydrogenase-like enzyme